MGKDGGKRGLTRTRRPPQQKRGDAATLDQLAEELTGADQVVLADKILQTQGSHALGKRTMR